MMISDYLVNTVKRHEGWRGHPYMDSRGFQTVGFGCRFPLTKEEGEIILRRRLHEKQQGLEIALSRIGMDFTALPEAVRDTLSEMAYQMGVQGTMSFRKMLAAIADEDWETAVKEAYSSRWYKQTPARVDAVMERMRLLYEA